MHKLSLILMTFLLFGMTGCATSPPGPPPPRFSAPALVVDKLWGWERTETPVELFESPDPKRFTLRLMPDGKAQVVFDCNRGGGSYQISEGKLSFSPMASTRMACTTDNRPLDQHFSKQLQGAASFFVENGKLYLELPVDGGTMRFSELKH
jgi:heat shock protein HslJ